MGGVYTVPATINDTIRLDFIVDSDAADVSIPTDVILTLMRARTITDSDFLPGQQTYVTAEGAEIPSYRFRLRSLTVGDKTARNVLASVASLKGLASLGRALSVAGWGAAGSGPDGVGPELAARRVAPTVLNAIDRVPRHSRPPNWLDLHWVGTPPREEIGEDQGAGNRPAGSLVAANVRTIPGHFRPPVRAMSCDVWTVDRENGRTQPFSGSHFIIPSYRA